MTNYLKYSVISKNLIKRSRVIVKAIISIVLIVTCISANTVIAQAISGDRRLALSGFEGGPGNTYSYLGMIQPLHKSLGDSIVTRIWLDRLSYTYINEDQKINAEAFGGEGALGYRKPTQWGWWAAYAGALYRDTSFSPDDLDSKARGGIARAKFQIEGERNFTERWRANAMASYVAGQNSYWTRGRLLYRAGEIVSTGPEVIGLGDRDYNIMQFGWTVVGIRIMPGLDVNLKGGARIIQGSGTTGYGGIEIGYPF